MVDNALRHIVVVRDGAFVSYVSARDIFCESLLINDVEMRKKLAPVAVRDVMKFPPISTLPEATIREAILTMANKNIGFLVLTRGDQLVGVVSARDIVKALASGTSLDAPVEKMATKRVINIEAKKSVVEAADLTAEHRIRHPVVVDEGRISGVVSLRDLVKLIK